MGKFFVDTYASLQNCIRQIDWAFLNPLYPALLTLVVVATGMIGSVYSPEIKQAFPLTWPARPWEASGPAMLFWGLAAISAIAYFFRQMAVDLSREAAQGHLEDRADELKEIIRTMPPANFLEHFAQAITEADEAVELLAGASSEEDLATLKEGVRHILKLIAVLAQRFDGGSAKTEYAANVMWFRPTTGLGAAELEEIQKRIKFCEEGVHVGKLKAVLDLDVELSTTSKSASAEPDALKPIALPIPATSKVGNRYKVLPGAPFAAVTKDAAIYFDTATLREWCLDSGDFSPGISNAVHDYFNGGPLDRINSFVSIPLFCLDDQNKMRDPIAVLNIHSETRGILRSSGEIARQFVLVMRPLELSLAKLLSAIDEP